ncbi:MAG: hypothetical protein HYV09_36775 [Deltaproteobacteria bacterium]|nr:hypothetical protein [Deltaproteobacteria bacterium]
MARKPTKASQRVGTVAFYGPDDKRASKMVVAVFANPDDEEPSALERWFTEGDARGDHRLARLAVDFLTRSGVHRIAMADRIIGCPHEEGIDYPEGESCPRCPFWVGRDRFTGELMGEASSPSARRAEALAMRLAKG